MAKARMVKVAEVPGTYFFKDEKYGPFASSKSQPHTEIPEELALALGLPDLEYVALEPVVIEPLSDDERTELEDRISELEARLSVKDEEKLTKYESQLAFQADQIGGAKTRVKVLEDRITELEDALEQGGLLELETDYTVSGLQKIAASLGLEDAGNKGELAARIRAVQEVSSDPVTDATG